MNFAQQTRVIELEMIAAGLKDPRLELPEDERQLVASRLAAVHTFPENGDPSIGMGGGNTETWLRGYRGINPEDFAGHAVNHPNTAETAVEKAMRVNRLSQAEWAAKSPEFRRNEVSVAEGDPGMTYAGVKSIPYAGKTKAEIESMSLEDRLAAANEFAFNQLAANKGARS